MWNVEHGYSVVLQLSTESLTQPKLGREAHVQKMHIVMKPNSFWFSAHVYTTLLNMLTYSHDQMSA